MEFVADFLNGEIATAPSKSHFGKCRMIIIANSLYAVFNSYER